MNAKEDNILDVSLNYYKYLMSLENVNGVGLGYKYINGINTFEPCLNVLVKKKLNSKFIPNNNIIPKTYMGIKTDVMEVGKIKFSSNEKSPLKLRPLEGGCAVANIYDEADVYGTLACIAFKVIENSKNYYLLSNSHVLANLEGLPLGTPIIQPCRIEADTEITVNEKVVGHLTNYNRLVPFKKEDPKANLVDCGIAKLIDHSLISNIISTIGPIKGIATASLGMSVKKFGAVTGLTTGTVNTIGATVKLEEDNDELYYFLDQMVLDLDGDEGDSGSLVLNDNNEVVGLSFSTTFEQEEGEEETSTFVYANKISEVLDTLKIELYIGD